MSVVGKTNRSRCGENAAAALLQHIVVVVFKKKKKKKAPLKLVLQSPGEIKRSEVSCTLTKKLAQKRSRAGRRSWA